jgi:hypothetical protein
MRVISQRELLSATKLELNAMLPRIAAELPLPSRKVRTSCGSRNTICTIFASRWRGRVFGHAEPPGKTRACSPFKMLAY